MRKRSKKSESERKVRSDKKYQINPFVPPYVAETLKHLSLISGKPAQDVSAIMCIAAIKHRPLIYKLVHFFRRAYEYRPGDVFIGDLARRSFKMELDPKKGREQVYMRFLRDDHEKIKLLKYSLDSSDRHAAAIALTTAVDLINEGDVWIIKNTLYKIVEQGVKHENRKRIEEFLRDIEQKTRSKGWLLDLLAEVYVRIVS